MNELSERLILASSSPYRASQLASLRLPFETTSPDVDESPQPDESVETLVQRLAFNKASVVADKNATATVIGGDQLCSMGGVICGKPKTVARAEQQLHLFAGQTVSFYTGLCVIAATGKVFNHIDLTTVAFRNLTVEEIERYVAAEQPLDCAGAFKVESLGLSLFTWVESSDPSALMGLPLIKLAEFLRLSGYQIP